MNTICFFGIYDPDYSRNRVLMKGFEENGWKVIQCRVDPRQYRGLKKYFKLFQRGIAMRRKKIDLVLVAFPGQTVVPIARLIFGKKIIFDAFLSLYDSNVFDRKLYGPKSIRGIKDFLLDWCSVRMSSKTLLDTYEHIIFFEKTFGISKEKCIRVLVGAEDHLFHPSVERKVDKKCIIEFHGTYIPLQGTEYIITAAAKLKNDPSIVFIMVGSGQMFQTTKKLADTLGATNVTFIGRVPFTSILEYIAEADICLGIFGDTNKTKRVIPNKVYECVAMGKPVITADSPAIREVFTNEKDMLFCTVSKDVGDLVQVILTLKNDLLLRQKIGRNARAIFLEKCRPKVIVENLIRDLC